MSDGSVGASGTAGTVGSGGSGGGPGSVPKAGTIPIARPEPSGCINNVGPGRLMITGCVPETDWVFNVSVPSQCLEKACGLIFDLHGSPIAFTAANHEQNTALAWRGERESYIVVQPDTRVGWGGSGRDSSMASFLRLAMDVWNVEQRRVHFTGFHTGAWVTFRMRCLLADVLASVAPVSPGAEEGWGTFGPVCPTGTPPIDTLWIHGRNETAIPADGQQEILQQLLTGYDLAIDRVLASEQTYTWTRYANREGLVLEFLQHSYGSTSSHYGACFLGGDTSSSTQRRCTGEGQPSHGQVVLDFFVANPRWR